ncbi:hypothetical protein GCM10023231_29320 [Olivibacter ginsenosidimutans]|uniref:WD40 repeat protein n=1 Tax=Olivibacter ginsenosidimutans TaxID=1176537 RepID=A0ABP9BQB9_9SPHI
MKIYHLHVIVSLAALLSLTSCSKDDGEISAKGSWGAGRIYYTAPTEGVLFVDLKEKQLGTLLAADYDRHDWDVSLDGSKVVTSANTNDLDYNAEMYTISNVSDGRVLSQFKYHPAEGDYTSPRFSPDGSMLATEPTWDEGIVIMNVQGSIKWHIDNVGGQKFEQNILAWMPDNTFLCMVGNTLYRTNTDWDYVNPIASLNLSKWGAPRASPDGSKIAYASDGHIWMMNADGSNQVQVTTSSDEECYPTFSPDGKHLLIGVHFIESLGSNTGGVFTDGVWKLAIIPADGKQYNVDEGADDHVVQLVLRNGNNESCDGYMVWR